MTETEKFLFSDEHPVKNSCEPGCFSGNNLEIALQRMEEFKNQEYILKPTIRLFNPYLYFKETKSSRCPKIY